MRKFLAVLIGVAVLALAGCVYPGYTYVRGGYGGYYTGDAYYYDDAYAPAYYYGGYGCCGWYGPSVNVGVGYYGGGYYGGGHYGRGYRGYRGYRGGYQGRGWSGQSRHGDSHRGSNSWHHH